MPSFTKRAIIESFLHLAGKKPPDKITVRDIVDDCGINRNTFYYYFQDIYAVLEELCGNMLQRLPEQQPLCHTLSTFYRFILSFCEKYPHAAKSLALSLGFEGMERYFAKDLDAVILAGYQHSLSGAPNRTELRMIRHAILGLCLDAMRDPKHLPEDTAELESFLHTLLATKPDNF